METLQKSVHYLASDELEGRGMGTQGLETAAQYIGGYFSGLGLKPPPGQNDYFQEFTYTAITGIAPQTRLAINQLPAGGPNGPQAAPDFVPLTISAEGEFQGPVAFVGYGIRTKDYDDYAGVDLRGKVALALMHQPHDAEGRSRLGRDRWSDMRKARLAAERGAAALLLVHPPAHHGAENLDATIERWPMEAAPIPVIQVSAEIANRMLRDAGTGDLATYQSQIDGTFTPHSLILRRSHVNGAVAFARTTYRLRNVTALLPGKGMRAKEYIVVGAHYDHLGRGGFGSLAPGSREIHNGADDNASGTAAIMEIARLFSISDRLPRSILFVAFSGEEHGLLGSRHWVENPPVPLKRVVAMLNFDMVGRVRDNRIMIGGASTAGPFEELLRRADDASPLAISTMISESTAQTAGFNWSAGVAPSDSTSFVLRRIPVLFFWSGNHPDYHKPTDDADRINYDGLAQTVDLATEVIRHLSITRDLRYTEPPSSTRPTTQPADPSVRSGGATLGIVPEYGEPTVRGVKLAGTMPGSPAAKAGLLPGDVLVEFDGRKIDGIYDLTDALSDATPGETVKLRLLRNGDFVEMSVTLGQRRSR